MLGLTLNVCELWTGEAGELQDAERRTRSVITQVIQGGAPDLLTCSELTAPWARLLRLE